MIISLDTETTGLDIRHGAKPFIVTTCDEVGEHRDWEWWVDPLTRGPIIPKKELRQVQELIDGADKIVMQNAKFDLMAIRSIGIVLHESIWDKLHETLYSAHLLASNQKKDLDTLAIVYLGMNIGHLDDAVKEACRKARNIARSKFPKWRIAKKGLPEMPSGKDSIVKFDMWLPRLLAAELGYKDEHPWHTVTLDYANGDSAVTLPIHEKHMELIERRELMEHYEQRRKCLRLVLEMEDVGVTLSGKALSVAVADYTKQSDEAELTCVEVAEGFDYDLTLPKSGNNKSLTSFVFDVLKLPPVKRSKKTGAGSLDKNSLDAYIAALEDNPESPHYIFINALKSKRKRDTAISYMKGYRKFWFPIGKDWYRLHPSLNVTGTDTLRWSSSNPNEQNISKQKGFNIRQVFGPAPGREWWSCDAKNIELRIPAYEANERTMIELFERPDDPPYYGSNHLLVSHILHKKRFEECRNDKGEIDGRIFKDRYDDTYYQWTKNGNFAVTYGAVAESGTADRAYHIEGAQAKVESVLKGLKRLNKHWIDFANEYGYVETIPDKSMTCGRGYPLLCSRNRWGGIMPTVPLNYHVQGTAIEWMMRAMLRCGAYLQQLNAAAESRGYWMIMQVHDELVFDFPKGRGEKPWLTNLPKIRKIQSIMRKCGDDIDVPTPVSCKYHALNWAEGLAV